MITYELPPLHPGSRRVVRVVVCDGITPDELAASDLPAADRVWALVAALPPRERVSFAAWCARRAGPRDPRSLAAVEAAEVYAAGGPRPPGLVRYDAFDVARKTAAAAEAHTAAYGARAAASAAHTAAYGARAAAYAAEGAAARCAFDSVDYAVRAAAQARTAGIQAQINRLVELHS